VGVAAPCLPCNIAIPVAAYDAHHHFVNNLAASDFEITEGAAVRQVRSVEIDQRPLLLAIVVDASRSMKGSGEAIVEALRTSGSTGNPTDRTALITFSNEPRLIVPFTREFTRVLAAAQQTVCEGSSPLFDAIALAAGQLGNRPNFRRAMLIFSDGRDNGSSISYARLRESVRQSGIVLHVVTVRGWLDEQSPVNQMLRVLSEESGGVYLLGESVRDWPRLAAQLNFRRQYVVTVQGAPPDGRYHRIRLRLKSSAAREVRSPRGYFSQASGVCP
jgi:VWFA-related protein